MIFPDKHINLNNSLFCIGFYILKTLKVKKTVSRLWEENKNNAGSFKKFSLALSWLYIVDSIEFEDGFVKRK